MSLGAASARYSGRNPLPENRESSKPKLGHEVFVGESTKVKARHLPQFTRIDSRTLTVKSSETGANPGEG
jgi:hypothetical protein